MYKLSELTEGKNTNLEKIMITNTPSLHRAIEGSEKVLYFTHDYFTLAPDKNLMIQATAGKLLRISFIELTKKLGVKKTICVCPIEYDHYSELKESPFELRQMAESNAL
jgi:hypothetical protein